MKRLCTLGGSFIMFWRDHMKAAIQHIIKSNNTQTFNMLSRTVIITIQWCCSVTPSYHCYHFDHFSLILTVCLLHCLSVIGIEK